MSNINTVIIEKNNIDIDIDNDNIHEQSTDDNIAILKIWGLLPTADHNDWQVTNLLDPSSAPNYQIIFPPYTGKSAWAMIDVIIPLTDERWEFYDTGLYYCKHQHGNFSYDISTRLTRIDRLARKMTIRIKSVGYTYHSGLNPLDLSPQQIPAPSTSNPAGSILSVPSRFVCTNKTGVVWASQDPAIHIGRTKGNP